MSSRGPADTARGERSAIRTATLRLFTLLLATSACQAGLKKAAVSIVSSGRPPREIYERGEKMLKRGIYEKALEDFQELRNFHRDDPLSVRAELAIAEINFRKGDYEGARLAFRQFEDYHPNFAPDYVTYMTGFTVWKQSPRVVGRDQTLTRAAVSEWTGFEQLFPESEYVDEVSELYQKGIDRLAAKEMFVARFYRSRKAWGAVRMRSEGILQGYQGSRFGEEALALLAESYHRVGRVDDAKLARERLLATFPETSRVNHVDRVLAGQPGTPPEDEIFARPYRIPTLGQPAPTQQPGR